MLSLLHRVQQLKRHQEHLESLRREHGEAITKIEQLEGGRAGEGDAAAPGHITITDENGRIEFEESGVDRSGGRSEHSAGVGGAAPHSEGDVEAPGGASMSVDVEDDVEAAEGQKRGVGKATLTPISKRGRRVSVEGELAEASDSGSEDELSCGHVSDAVATPTKKSSSRHRSGSTVAVSVVVCVPACAECAFLRSLRAILATRTPLVAARPSLHRTWRLPPRRIWIGTKSCSH